MSRAWVLPITALLASCSWFRPVDETGYNNPSDAVDETGYMDPDQVYTSAAAPLSETPQPIWVVGLPEALTEQGGMLTVDNAGVVTSALVAEDGGFVITPTASLHDELTLVYTAADDSVQEHALDLAGLVGSLDEVDAVFEDEAAPGDGGDGDGDTADTAEILDTDPPAYPVSPPNGQGSVTISLSPVPPAGLVVAFNDDTGATASASEGETTVALQGEAGHTVCLFGHDTSNPTKVWCGLVP